MALNVHFDEGSEGADATRGRTNESVEGRFGGENDRECRLIPDVEFAERDAVVVIRAVRGTADGDDFRAAYAKKLRPRQPDT